MVCPRLQSPTGAGPGVLKEGGQGLVAYGAVE